MVCAKSLLISVICCEFCIGDWFSYEIICEILSCDIHVYMLWDDEHDDDDMLNQILWMFKFMSLDVLIVLWFKCVKLLRVWGPLGLKWLSSGSDI